MEILLMVIRLLRPPHPLDNGGKDSDPVYRAQLYEVRQRGWQWRINHTVLCVVMFCMLMVWALTSPRGLPIVGAIAWANDTDAKIKAAIDPVQGKLDEISRQMEHIKKHQDSKEFDDLRQKLFETRIAQCQARSPKGNNPYASKMNELQQQYHALTNTWYTPDSCEDL
jgi:hypothetical protein